MTSNGGTAAGGTMAPSLRARLRLEPHPDAECGILAAGDRGEVLGRTVVRHLDGGSDACLAEVAVVDGEHRDRRWVASGIDECCLCPAFRTNECIADVRSFHDDALVVAVRLPDRGTLRTVVDALRERGASVHLEQLQSIPADGADGQVLEVDTGRITDKQWEAVDAALEAGYYESPRRADLEEIADELGVTPSAISQRLNAVEAKLVSELANRERTRHTEDGIDGRGLS